MGKTITLIIIAAIAALMPVVASASGGVLIGETAHYRIYRYTFYAAHGQQTTAIVYEKKIAAGDGRSQR